MSLTMTLLIPLKPNNRKQVYKRSPRLSSLSISCLRSFWSPPGALLFLLLFTFRVSSKVLLLWYIPSFPLLVCTIGSLIIISVLRSHLVVPYLLTVSCPSGHLTSAYIHQTFRSVVYLSSSICITYLSVAHRRPHP